MPRTKHPMVSCSPDAGIITRSLLRYGFTFAAQDCYRVTELPPWTFAVDGGRYWAKREHDGFIPVDFALRVGDRPVTYWHVVTSVDGFSPKDLERVEYLSLEAQPPYMLSLTNVPQAAISRLFGEQPLLAESLTGIHQTSDVIAYLQAESERAGLAAQPGA